MGEYADYEVEKSECLENDFDFEYKKDKRKSNTEWSTKYLIDNKIQFESKNGGAHLVLEDYDFWPATGLFISKATKQKGRGVKKLVKKIILESKQ
jgi:hypothetical protein